jgi:hypothetical protein
MTDMSEIRIRSRSKEFFGIQSGVKSFVVVGQVEYIFLYKKRRFDLEEE